MWQKKSGDICLFFSNHRQVLKYLLSLFHLTEDLSLLSIQILRQWQNPPLSYGQLFHMPKNNLILKIKTNEVRTESSRKLLLVEVLLIPSHCHWGMYTPGPFKYASHHILLALIDFLYFQRRPFSMVHKKSMISYIDFLLLLLLRRSYCMQLSLLYSNFLFTEINKDLLIVFKYHVLSKSWTKCDFAKLRSGHLIFFLYTTTASGCLSKNWNSLLYC